MASPAFLDCSQFRTEPCINIDIFDCECKQFRLIDFERARFRPNRNGVGDFSIEFCEGDLPDSFIGCCSKITVTMDWPEAGVSKKTIFSGVFDAINEDVSSKIIDENKFDQNISTFIFRGKSLDQKLADTPIAYLPNTPGAEKPLQSSCSRSPSATQPAQDGEILPGQTLQIDLPQPCESSQFSQYEAQDNVTNATVQVEQVTRDQENSLGQTLIDIDGDPITETLWVLNITPNEPGPFSASFDIFCDCQLVETFDYSDTADDHQYDWFVENLNAGEPIDINLSQSGNSCGDGESEFYVIDADTLINVSVVNNGGGAIVVTPENPGLFSFEYSIFCRCDNGQNCTEGECNEVVAGASVFGYALEECAITITAIEAAYQYATENLVMPIEGRGDGTDCGSLPGSCFEVVDYTDRTSLFGSPEWSGSRSYKNLLETLQGIADYGDFTWNITLDENCCCVMEFNGNRDLTDVVLSECLENVSITNISTECVAYDRVHVLGVGEDNGNQRTVVSVCTNADIAIDNNCCFREAVIENKDEIDPLALEIEGLEFLRKSNKPAQIGFDSNWSCSFIPFRDIELGDIVTIEHNGSKKYRLAKMPFEIQSGDDQVRLVNVAAVFEEVS